ncbi:MAG: hypothetical protein KAU20_06735 [Nanoarchaeota archaeon]|nr:hypothetical protein [Nanoarchaeota archaeon]
MEEKKETKEQENKKSYLFAFIVFGSIILVFIIAFFAIGFFNREVEKTMDEIIYDTLQGKETEFNYMYNGHVFVYFEGLWHTRWKRDETIFNTHFHYGPRDVEDVPVIGGLDPNLNTSKFYITFDPLEENISLIALASSELGLSLVRVMNVQLTPACYRNETYACSTRPIITCENTDEAVIYVREDDKTKVLLDDNCIIVQGKGNDLLKAVDKMLFNLYGIIKHE